MESIPEDVLIVLDEAYADYVDDPEYPASLGYLDRHRNLIIVRTFSKIYGLAGLRIGYAIADEDVVKMMRKAREPYSVNRVGQAGAIAALDDSAFAERTRRAAREGLRYYYDSFDQMGLEYSKSQANFILVDVAMDANVVSDSLLGRGIHVRPLAHDELTTYLRITIGLEEQNQAVVAALREVLLESEEAH